MIKGVNKRIIEINNPESIYFEKAIFYLRPNVRELPTAVTEAEIKKYIDKLGIESFGTHRRVSFKIIRIILIFTAFAAAAGLTAHLIF